MHLPDKPTELVKSEDLFKEVREALRSLNKMDFDKLVAAVRAAPFLIYASLTVIKLAASDTRPTLTTAKTAFARVSQMLSLRDAVRSLPLLQSALAGSRSQILRIIHDVRQSPSPTLPGSDVFHSKFRTSASKKWTALWGRV